MQRGLETLTVFERFCHANELAPEDVHVVATSAIRDASNGSDFVAQAQTATGLTIEVLSGEDEARYGYRRRDQHLDADRRGGARDRRRQHAADHGRRAPPAGDGLVPARGGAADRAVPARRRTGQEEGRPAGPRIRPPHARERRLGMRARASGSSESAARSATSPPPREPEVEQIDIGVQGFVITREAMARPGAAAGGDAGVRAGRRPRDQARARRHHSRGGDDARDGARAGRVRRDRGDRGGAA